MNKKALKTTAIYTLITLVIFEALALPGRTDRSGRRNAPD